MKTSTFDIYAVITDKIIAQLESGNIPWLKPWKNKDANNGTIASLSFNGFSGRNYNGLNLLLLGSSEFTSNAWYSYPKPQGYAVSVFSVLDKPKHSKPYPTTSLMDLFHVEAREVSQSVDLFGEGVQ